MPLVSIIIPNYNGAEFLQATLDSVSAQSYSNWEGIIVDDGSEDESIQIIQRFTEADKRFRFFSRPLERTKGASVCRNIGLAEAKGEFVLFLDADDLLSSFCLAQRIQAFSGFLNHDFLIFTMQYFSAVDSETNAVVNKDEVVWDRENYLKKFLSYELPWAITCPFWKREFLNGLGGFDENFQRMQDPELHTRALLIENVQFKRIFDRPPDCFYRTKSPDVSENKQLKMVAIKSMFQYLQKFQTLVENDPKVYQDSIECFASKMLRRAFFYKFGGEPIMEDILCFLNKNRFFHPLKRSVFSFLNQLQRNRKGSVRHFSILQRIIFKLVWK